MKENDTALFFDVETNKASNFTTLDGVDKIHCISIYDPKQKRVVTFTGSGIDDGIRLLNTADIIVGHNIIGFDLPVLRKLCSWIPKVNLLDTLIMSRCVHPDIRGEDMRNKKVPKELWGSHSLKAWGLRLDFSKGLYGDSDTAFEEYTEEMRAYCERDVMVTAKLFNHLADEEPTTALVNLEHAFARILRYQELRGFAFDEEAALALAEKLTTRRAEIKDELQELFPPVVEEMKTAAGWSLDLLDSKGNTVDWIKAPTKTALKEELKSRHLKQSLADDARKLGNKKKYIPFNPGSRDQIAKRLFEKYEWLPEQRTPDGRPKIDEAILKAMKFPEAAVLCEYLMVAKRLGQLAEGKEAWLKVVRFGRIHGKVNTNGAVTGRCTHSSPNLAQVPATRAAYGEECRSLFIPAPKYELVGVDASGLELRCLAHYLAIWDQGEYARFVTDGDIHSVNQKAAGLATRDQAKTFIYAFLYGAGDAKIGSIVGGNAKEGARLKKRFLKQLPALARLKSAVETKVKRSHELVGLDGRVLPIRSEHSALNTLLQSAGAVAMKNAIVILTKSLTRIGWKHGREWAFVANVHDEFQAEVLPDNVELYGKLAVEAIRASGESLKMSCPLDGEYKVGASWAETH